MTTDTRPFRDAEVAAWKGSGSFIALDGDNVAGWQPIEHVRAALDAAARDDEDGIRAALTRPTDDDEEEAHDA